MNLVLHGHMSVLLFPQSPSQNLSIQEEMPCKLLKLVGTEVILHYTKPREKSP